MALFVRRKVGNTATSSASELILFQKSECFPIGVDILRSVRFFICVRDLQLPPALFARTHSKDFPECGGHVFEFGETAVPRNFGKGQ